MAGIARAHAEVTESGGALCLGAAISWSAQGAAISWSAQGATLILPPAPALPPSTVEIVNRGEPASSSAFTAPCVDVLVGSNADLVVVEYTGASPSCCCSFCRCCRRC